MGARGYASIPLEQVLSERWLRAESAVVKQVVLSLCHFGQRDDQLSEAIRKGNISSQSAPKVYLVREITKWVGNADE